MVLALVCIITVERFYRNLQGIDKHQRPKRISIRLLSKCHAVFNAQKCIGPKEEHVAIQNSLNSILQTKSVRTLLG